jgi:hypothetical protein
LAPLQRSALVAQAERIANAKIKNKAAAKWTRCFSDTMDELSKPLLNGSNGIS